MRLRQCEDSFCLCFGRCFEKVLRQTNDEERRNIPGNQLFVRPSGHTTEGHCPSPTIQMQLASRQRVGGEQHRPRRGSDAQQSEWSSDAEKAQGRYDRVGQGQTCEILRRSFGKPGHTTASGVLLVQPGTTPGSSRDGGVREDQQDERRLQDRQTRQKYATLSADFITNNTPGGLGGREFQVTRPLSTASPSTSAPRQLNTTSSRCRALQVLNPDLISLKSCRTLFVSFVSFLML